MYHFLSFLTHHQRRKVHSNKDRELPIAQKQAIGSLSEGVGSGSGRLQEMKLSNIEKIVKKRVLVRSDSR